MYVSGDRAWTHISLKCLVAITNFLVALMTIMEEQCCFLGYPLIAWWSHAATNLGPVELAERELGVSKQVNLRLIW